MVRLNWVAGVSSWTNRTQYPAHASQPIYVRAVYVHAVMMLVGAGRCTCMVQYWLMCISTGRWLLEHVGGVYLTWVFTEVLLWGAIMRCYYEVLLQMVLYWWLRVWFAGCISGLFFSWVIWGVDRVWRYSYWNHLYSLWDQLWLLAICRLVILAESKNSHKCTSVEIQTITKHLSQIVWYPKSSGFLIQRCSQVGGTGMQRMFLGMCH